jgi:hypothetical protein
LSSTGQYATIVAYFLAIRRMKSELNKLPLGYYDFLSAEEIYSHALPEY